MKNFLKNSLALLTLSALIFTACDPEDEEGTTIIGPSLALTSQLDAEYPEGAEVDLTYSWTAPGKIGQVQYEILIDGSVVSDTTFTNAELGFSNQDSVGTLNFGFTVPANTAGSTIDVEATLIDRENQSVVSSEASFDVTAEAPLVNFSAVLLAAPVQDSTSSTGSKTSQTFFSTNTGETYSMAQVIQSSQPLSSNIDFGYFYGSGDTGTKATIAAPDNYPFAYGQANWGTRNETNLRRTTVTESQYNEANATFISTAFEEGTPGATDGRIVNLAEGDVLAFETASTKEGGSKRGLLLVESITAAAGSDGRISFSIVMEE